MTIEEREMLYDLYAYAKKAVLRLNTFKYNDLSGDNIFPDILPRFGDGYYIGVETVYFLKPNNRKSNVVDTHTVLFAKGQPHPLPTPEYIAKIRIMYESEKCKYEYSASLFDNRKLFKDWR